MDTNTLGSGKSSIVWTPWCFTPEVEAIRKEAKDIEDGVIEADDCDWLDSLTKEEVQVQQRLFEEHDEAMTDHIEHCPIGTDKSCGHGCEMCQKAIERGTYTFDCATKCPTYLKDVETESRLRDFEDTHGSHICRHCFFWGQEDYGKCEKTGMYVRARAKSCSMFHTETEDEQLRRTHTGPYESDEERATRLKWEQDHAEELSAERLARRRDIARKYSELMNNGVDSARDAFHIAGEFLKKAYADCPDVFATTPWKTYEDLERAFGE